MYIFIDESGIHKQIDHSTLVVVFVSVEDTAVTENRILEIESELKIGSFHWFRHAWVIREKFLRKIRRLDFSVKAVIFKNPIRINKCVEETLPDLLTDIEVKKVFIDGKKPKWYELKIKKILKDKNISVKKLRTVKDESEPCVRLADAMAGLIRSYYDNPEGKSKELYLLFRNKITPIIARGQDSAGYS